ncbi:hypothetical protein KC678_02840 [Candidatus Dojkabacteria bacterium]|uniref:Uncharacterized protein n=1 Tax=Candidatus Dojkabacteria bacterium TaxID=2099670 RepID=A0A955IBG1_9BACT|nr:hypothetical protein [Candidatus Dojkabacteria bacterium]
MINKEEVLKRIGELIEDEGISTKSNLSTEELFKEFILPSLDQSKQTLSSLYKFEVKNYSGIFGKLKSKIINKIKNIVINVVERESMRQQKFNELVYQSLLLLIDEKSNQNPTSSSVNK